MNVRDWIDEILVKPEEIQIAAILTGTILIILPAALLR